MGNSVCKEHVGERKGRGRKMCREAGRARLMRPSKGHAGCCCMRIEPQGTRGQCGMTRKEDEEPREKVGRRKKAEERWWRR